MHELYWILVDFIAAAVTFVALPLESTARKSRDSSLFDRAMGQIAARPTATITHLKRY